MKKLLTLSFLLVSCFQAQAWWETGHELVCDEAYKLLSPQALAAVDNMLEDHGSLADSCLWADEIKGDRKDTRDWHYINLPESEQNVFTAVCPQNGCLIQAFNDQMAVLGNKDSSVHAKKEALWFVGHFVGDVHQPMHAGYPHDYGGNRHRLVLSDGSKTNMHMVWDGQIITHMESKVGTEEFVAGVRQKIKDLATMEQSPLIEAWAQESRNLAMDTSVGYKDAVLKVASNEYLESHSDTVQERIALAAIRLSQTLNSIFVSDE